MIQEPSTVSGGEADIIFLTHEAVERNVNQAIGRIEALPAAKSAVTRLRMENLS